MNRFFRNSRRALPVWMASAALCILGVGCPSWLTTAHAKSDREQENKKSIEEAAALTTLIPTPNTLSFTFKNYAIVSQWDTKETSNFVLLRVRAPLKISGRNNYMRISIPYFTKSRDGPGLSSVEIFDMALVDTSWGQWGVGPLAVLQANRNQQRDTLQLGPVLEATVWVTDRWDIRILNRNFFDTQSALTTTQATVYYKFRKNWFFCPFDSEFPYDWTHSRFSFISLGIQVGAAAQIWGQDIRFLFNPLFNPVHRSGVYQWEIITAVTFTFPTH